MTSKMLTCKTYPSECLSHTEKINMVALKPLPKIDEVNVKIASIDEISDSIPSVEIAFECKQIKNSENSASHFTKITTINCDLNELNINNNDFPSIDNSEVVPIKIANVVNNSVHVSRNQIDSSDPKAPKEWKREKTFDGCPIYRVMFNIKS